MVLLKIFSRTCHRFVKYFFQELIVDLFKIFFQGFVLDFLRSFLNFFQGLVTEILRTCPLGNFKTFSESSEPQSKFFKQFFPVLVADIFKIVEALSWFSEDFLKPF